MATKTRGHKGENDFVTSWQKIKRTATKTKDTKEKQLGVLVPSWQKIMRTASIGDRQSANKVIWQTYHAYPSVPIKVSQFITGIEEKKKSDVSSVTIILQLAFTAE